MGAILLNLDLDAIFGESGADSLAGGKVIFYDNAVTEITKHSKNGKQTISGKVASDNETNEPSATFDEQGGLYDYSCSCGNAHVQSGPCKHVVALGLVYGEKFPQSISDNMSNSKKTDSVIFTLSSEYSQKKHTRRRASADGQVTLTPQVQIRNSKIFLNFTIGKGRNYTVKDISDFVSAYLRGANRRYGVKLSLDVVRESFTPHSQLLADFVVASFREKADISELLNSASTRKEELMLLGGDVDAFFKMHAGQIVDFGADEQGSGFRKIIDTVDTLDTVVKVTSEEGGYNITSGLDIYNLVYGKEFNYLVSNAKVYKITAGLTEAVMPLLKTLVLHSKLFVTEKDMPIFYNSVLSSVNKYIQIESDSNLLQYEAPPFIAKMYLNLGASGGLNAELECSYDDKKLDILDENFSADMVRDWEAERCFKNVLADFFPSYPHLMLTAEWDIYKFLKNGVADIYKFADVYFAEEVKKIKIKAPPRIKVGVRLDADLLKVDLDADEYTTDELRAILTAHRESKKYIRLNDGSFVDLTDPSITALGEIFSVTTSVSDTELSIPKYYAPFLDNELKSGMFTFDRNVAFKELVKSIKNASDEDIQVPSILKDTLRNYQKTGFRWLKTLSANGFGGILADDMGLGKSLQVVSLLVAEKPKSSIVVCPTSLILNWASEFRKFAPQIKVLTVMGNQDERASLIKTLDKYDVVVTSYELLRRDADSYSKHQFDYSIIDEAQYIKNPETKNAIAVKKLNAKRRFALTGTPIENSLSELWSIFDFIMPNYLNTYTKFKEQYESEILRDNEKATAKFKRLVSPFILRRLKSNVLPELPSKIETVISSPLADDQRKLYKANFNLIKDSVNNKDSKVNKIAVLSMLTKLRQICCEPSLVYSDYTGNSAKRESCLELIENAVAGGHKILLFSQFTQMIDILRGDLVKKGISNYVLKGDTAKTERMRLVNKFNKDDTSVFLISLKAGGTGLNLTGADVVIHYDPWWNESVMNQATDRAYRIGQDKAVQVYKLVLKDSLEENIVSLQEKKTALSNTIIGDSVSAVEFNDLLKIFGEE